MPALVSGRRPARATIQAVTNCRPFCRFCTSRQMTGYSCRIPLSVSWPNPSQLRDRAKCNQPYSYCTQLVCETSPIANKPGTGRRSSREARQSVSTTRPPRGMCNRTRDSRCEPKGLQRYGGQPAFGFVDVPANPIVATDDAYIRLLFDTFPKTGNDRRAARILFEQHGFDIAVRHGPVPAAISPVTAQVHFDAPCSAHAISARTRPHAGKIAIAYALARRTATRRGKR